jgi:hypothetical protein
MQGTSKTEICDDIVWFNAYEPNDPSIHDEVVFAGYEIRPITMEGDTEEVDYVYSIEHHHTQGSAFIRHYTQWSKEKRYTEAKDYVMNCAEDCCEVDVNDPQNSGFQAIYMWRKWTDSMEMVIVKKTSIYEPDDKFVNDILVGDTDSDVTRILNETEYK